MWLEHLQVRQFRNIEALDWRPHPRANLLLGANAQGKTNLLEAIFMLGTSKSLRGKDGDELIMDAASESFISAQVRRQEAELKRELELKLRRGESKEMRLNGKRLSPLSKIFGQLSVVLFVPEDLQIVKAGPAARRYYLDLEISQASPEYLKALQDYQRCLKQRNGALRMHLEKRGPWEGVEAFNSLLASSGSQILRFRLEALREIEPIAAKLQTRIAASESEQLGLNYRCSFELGSSLSDLETRFEDALKERAKEERLRGLTLCGPHRDDFEILISGRAARLYASQGQQRSSALALKLAELNFLAKRLGENPILLLDDVLSELDLERQSALLGLLDEEVQTFVTATHASGLAYHPSQTLKVQAGHFEIQ